MKKIRIVLADLCHNRRFYEYTVPLNIGYIAARLEQRVGNAVEFSLFKFPDDLILALKSSPDILALSNYDWNRNINRAIIKIARDINPNILVIMGGAGIKKSPAGIKEFLLAWPIIDIYVINEGEDGFCSIIEYILSKWPCNLKETIIGSGIKLPNTAYLEKETKQLMLGGLPDTALDKNIPFPSPWLSGLLDPFLEQDKFPLTALVETNRGCPYQCTFCERGNNETLYNKVRVFDYNMVIDELRYVVKKANRIIKINIADANFGIIERDLAIAEEIRRLSDTYKNISRVIINNAKNTTDRIVTIAKILGKLSVPDYPAQSFNKVTLENTKRTNINLDVLKPFIAQTKALGFQPYTDLLLGLPGETKESTIKNIKKAHKLGFHNTQYADVRIFPGSPMGEDDYLKKHEIVSGWRVIPSGYGEYGGVKVMEFEECIRKTKTMSKNDFLELRLVVGHEYLLNYFELGIRPLVEFSHKYGFDRMDLIDSLSTPPIKKDYPLLAKYMDEYIENAKVEWFDSEEAAKAYYLQDEVFDNVMKEGFKKLNYEYAARLITDLKFREEFVKRIAEHIKAKLPDKGSIVDEIAQFCIRKVYQQPFDSIQNTMLLSKESANELNNFIDKQNNGGNGGKEQTSPVKVRFDINMKKLKYIKDEITRHGGQKNLSEAVEVILMKNNKVFSLGSSQV